MYWAIFALLISSCTLISSLQLNRIQHWVLAPLYKQVRLRWGQEQCQLLLVQQCTLGAHKMGIRWHSRAHIHRWTAQWRGTWWLLSSESAPTQTSQPQDIHIVQKWSREWLLLQLRTRPCPGGTVTTIEQRGAYSISSAGFGHHNISHTSWQEDNSQHMQRKEVLE